MSEHLRIAAAFKGTTQGPMEPAAGPAPPSPPRRAGTRPPQ